MAANTIKVKKRSLVLLIIYSIIIIALVFRIGYYQIVKGEEFSKKAYLNQTLNRIINQRQGFGNQRLC